MTHKTITSIVATLEDGEVVNINPRSGHSFIFAIELDDGFSRAVAGKAPKLDRLFRKLLNLVPPFVNIATSIAMEKRLARIPDEAFRDLPVGGNA